MNSINHQANEALDDLPSQLGTAAFPKYIQCSPIMPDVGKAKYHKKARHLLYKASFSQKRNLRDFQNQYNSKTN